MNTNMNTRITKNFLREARNKLEKEKKSIEEQLRAFAEKDVRPKGDWDTKFPHFDGGIGSQRLEEAADEVEEYSTKLPIEFRLELKLRDINSALDKIKKGEYGKCERCRKLISLERLKIYPEARFCLKCSK